MYVYCVESFAHIECYSDCSRRGSQLVEPLFFGVVYSSVFEISERGIWACMRCPCLSVLGFEMGTMLANFHMCGIMLMLRVVFNMLVRNASPTGPMCFRCLMFSLSGSCELL